MRIKVVLSCVLGLFFVAAFAVADPPEASGIVLRGDDTWALVYFDDSGTKLVVYGADMVEYCQGIVDFDIWQYADKYLPIDEVVATITKGDGVRTTVWPFAVFDCNLFLNVPPLATGPSDVVYTDNNFYWDESDRAMSWNLSAHGVLTNSESEEFIFQHNLHCTMKGESPAKCHSKIRLR